MLNPEEILTTLTDNPLAGASCMTSVTTKGPESAVLPYAQEIGEPEIFAKSLLLQL